MKRFIDIHNKSIDQIKKFYENIILTNDYKFRKVDEGNPNEAFSYIIFDKEFKHHIMMTIYLE